MMEVNPAEEARRAFDDLDGVEQFLEMLVDDIEGADPDDMELLGLDSLIDLQADLAWRLAYFGDGPGYGYVGRNTLAKMAELEKRASALLEALEEDPDYAVYDCVGEC